MKIPSLYTIKQFSKRHPAFPEGSLRWRIHKAKTNGLAESGAIVRNGKRVLIDEEKWFVWLMSVNNS